MQDKQESAAPSNIVQINSPNQMRPVKYRYADSLACTYVVSVIAAGIAELVTYPLDLTKTRLQIQGEAAASKLKPFPVEAPKYRGMIATAYGIIKEEGPSKLWKGAAPALYRHVVYSGVRICSYDTLRREMMKSENENQMTFSLWKSALCGVIAGAVAQWLSSPADLVKVQIQMEGKRRLLNEPSRCESAAHAFRDIVKRGGIVGLWKGSIPNVQRAALVNLGDLTTYDIIKNTLKDKLHMADGHTVHVLSSICAGFVAAIMGTPADVIKTRIMNQPIDNKGRGLLYKGSVDCLKQTIAKEGFSSLYKGFLPCWIRMAPWSLTFWLSFENMRRMLGVSSY